MEHLEIVCENTGKPLGYSLPRGEAIATGAWCRSTNVFVLNSKGHVLCHQRSLNKERLPGGWSTHLGGHVGQGETFESNALKELEEEAGINLPAKSLIMWRTTKLEKSRLWVREFVIVHDVPAESLVPQPGEVERFAWMAPTEVFAAKEKEPHMWYAGTHDFRSEYHCLRAAITTAHSLGVVEAPEEMHAWQPAI